MWKTEHSELTTASPVFGKGIAGYYPTAVRQLVAAAERRADR